jgi:hypothetical protein
MAADPDWGGETDKYYDLRLHVYRLRSTDLDMPLPGQPATVAE